MIFCNENYKIIFDEGDFGNEILFEIIGKVQSNDKFIFLVSQDKENQPVIEKSVKANSNNLISFLFTKEDTAQLTSGCYVWSLKLYRENVLLCTLINSKPFEVKKGVIKNE